MTRGTLTGWRRPAARAAWALLTALLLARYFTATAARLSGPLTICPEGCLLTFEGRAFWGGLGLPLFWQVLLDNLPSFVLTGVYVATAVFIAWRRPDDWVALLASLTLTGLGAILFTGLVAGDDLPAWASGLLFELLAAAFSLLILVFPDGRLYPHGRPWALTAGLGLGLGPLLAGLSALTGLAWLSLARVALLFGLIGWGLAAQFYRYRRVSSPAQRQQIKWVTFGLLGPALAWLMFFVLTLRPGGAIGSLPGGVPRLVVFFLPPLAWPLALMAAILRYRLWAIDLIIRRTLVYGVLTSLLGLLYFATIVVLEGVLRALTGQAAPDWPAVVTVVVTLALAAAFRPLRARVQRVIDRAFYRRKYDAAQTLAGFGAALRADASADLDGLAEHLRAVVQQTMQPEHVDLWLARR